MDDLTNTTQKRADAIATQIIIELGNIVDSYARLRFLVDSYARLRFLEEIKDQTNYCWNCGDEFPYTGVCCCQCDD